MKQGKTHDFEFNVGDSLVRDVFYLVVSLYFVLF